MTRDALLELLRNHLHALDSLSNERRLEAIAWLEDEGNREDIVVDMTNDGQLDTEKGWVLR